MRAALATIVLLVLAAAAGGWWLSRPLPLAPETMAGLSGDAERGARVFAAAGCASCHAAPEAEGDDRLVLAGGQRFPSPFGTFVAPNISPDPDAGIGDWSAQDLANAMLRGISPDGAHYYPAFPYTTYARAEPQDVADLHAYLVTLPADATPNAAHEVGFPFNIRRGLGLWKRRYLSEDWVMTDPPSAEAERGRYLAEALGHCAECHTPRDAFGGLDTGRWLAGAPAPEGDGRVPDLRPGALTWSANDIGNYLSSGFTPEFDVAGGLMASVIENLKALPEADHNALAAYVKALPPAPE